MTTMKTKGEGMNITEATEIACKESTLLDALSHICVWESERVVEQAHRNLTNNTPINGDLAMWESCFKTCIKSVMENYEN